MPKDAKNKSARHTSTYPRAKVVFSPVVRRYRVPRTRPGNVPSTYTADIRTKVESSAFALMVEKVPMAKTISGMQRSATNVAIAYRVLGTSAGESM
jgi:hypothetical protein